jgi:hypothetical protein
MCKKVPFEVFSSSANGLAKIQAKFKPAGICLKKTVLWPPAATPKNVTFVYLCKDGVKASI